MSESRREILGGFDSQVTFISVSGVDVDGQLYIINAMFNKPGLQSEFNLCSAL